MSTTCFKLVKKGKGHNNVGYNSELKVTCESAVREHPGQPFECELMNDKPLVRLEDKKEWVIKDMGDDCYSFVPKWCPKNGD